MLSWYTRLNGFLVTPGLRKLVISRSEARTDAQCFLFLVTDTWGCLGATLAKLPPVYLHQGRQMLSLRLLHFLYRPISSSGKEQS